MNEYENQANDFLRDTKTTLKIEFKEFNSMPWDKDGQMRNIFICTLSNSNDSYSFDFGASINDSRKMIPTIETDGGDEIKTPTNYDVLACLSISYCETFDEFCDEFGYDNDSISALDTFNAVTEQSEALNILFDNDQIEMLHEIT
jgi:hypothetical protein